MKVVVIGAGIAGLSSAAFLAKQGYDVTILEKNDWIGGRVKTWKKKGYRFDLGPSCYLMPEEFDKWFDAFGYQRKDFYNIVRVDPAYKFFFDDDIIEVPADKNDVIKLFNSIEPGSGGRLQSLLYDAARDYKYIIENIAHVNTNNIYSKASVAADMLKNIGLQKVFKSYRSRIQKVTHDHRLLKILECSLIFLGKHSNNVSSTEIISNHINFSLGIWYPIGGFSVVIDAMLKVVRSLGVRVIVNSEVEVLEWDKKKIVGVSTNKKTYRSDLVVANADRHFVDQMLLPRKKREFKPHRWENANMSHGVLNLCLGIKDPLDNFASHTFFFDASWKEHLKSFRNKTWPIKPVFYAHCAAKTDPSAALENSQALFVRVPIASGIVDTHNERTTIVIKIIDRMAQYCSRNFSQLIEVEKIIGLSDYEQDFNAFKGNGFGISMDFKQTFLFRMPNKAKRVKNLYYAGQYTKPGAGLAQCLLSGRLAAQQAAYDTNKF